MTYAGNLPKHLEVAARTGILAAEPNMLADWRRVAMEVPLSAAATTLVDLGSVPAPTEQGRVVEDMIEKTKELVPNDWYVTLSLSQNAIDDDQTGSLERKFQDLRPAFDKHIDGRVFTVLNAGDSQTYGACYDGQDFIDSDHVDDGANYQTAQDNEGAVAISLDNFTTIWVAATQFVDDQGLYTNYNYNLLVTHPTNVKAAANITGNPEYYGTSDRDTNPHAGNFTYLVRSEFDTTAWHIIASGENTKPILVGMRKDPQLNKIWSAATNEGLMWYFQYHGRYVVGYGDWRLVKQGNT